MMWSKTRLGASNSIDDDSWEELAFVEDTTGAHGGCIWPPRSYTCSFCRREFRLAQALGGHMIVHRRDRARLKQSPDPHHGILHQRDCPNQTGLDLFPPQIRRFFQNPSPNSAEGADATAISPSMVLCQSNKEGLFEPKLPPDFPTSPNESRGRLLGGDPLFPSRLNWSSGNYNHVTNLKGTLGKSKKLSLNQKGHFGYKSSSDPGESNFPMSLSLATRTLSPSLEEEDEEEAMILTTICKRRRMEGPSWPFLLKRSFRAVVDMDELSDSTEEELDLELRLGKRPKVK